MQTHHANRGRFAAAGSVSDAVPMSLSKFGGGCFRVRRAIQVLARAGATSAGVLDMKIEGENLGCKTSDLGVATT